MLENEIIKLLRKISRQLEEISRSQERIKGEIRLLHDELLSFQEQTHQLESRLTKSELDLLN